MKHLLTLLFGLTFAAPLAGAPVPKGAKKADYYPLAVGHVWEYAEDGDVRTVTVTAVKEDKTGRLYTLAYKGEKKAPPTMERVYRVEDGQVFSMRADTSEAEKPSVIIKLGLREGDAWTTEHQWTGGDPWKISYKVGEQKKIKTPAGEFAALPVEYVSTRDGKESKELRWYADGVGFVRKEQDGKVISELKSFTPAK